MTRPAQLPVETVRSLPRDTGPVRLYAGAVRHLAGRAALLLSATALRLGRWAVAADPGEEYTARQRAVAARHPSAFPVHHAPGLVLHLTPRRPTGHGASEGDPTL